MSEPVVVITFRDSAAWKWFFREAVGPFVPTLRRRGVTVKVLGSARDEEGDRTGLSHERRKT